MSTSRTNPTDPTSSTDSPPIVASFSPASATARSFGGPTATSKHRSTILVHKKSPLLVATPPQVTRALAYSHPYLLPLNKLAGLLSWSTNDPWESFLLVAAFWAVTLYGDTVIRWAGPLVTAALLILGMYTRRYSPLSSTGWASSTPPSGDTASGGDGDGKKAGGKKQTHTKKESEGSSRHHKSLDEIVSTLQIFTTRCNILLDPFLGLTEFLSTGNTATSATTRPALTALFARLLLLSPVWFVLTLPPLYIITTRRAVLAVGTLILSWHSRPARVSRTILWRSRLIRRITAIITGLDFSNTASSRNTGTGSTTSSSSSSTSNKPPPLPPRRKPHPAASASTLTSTNKDKESIRFTFSLYENQRRWIGLGWTSSMLAYERAAWTDEHLNPQPPPEKFKLPETDKSVARWRWCDDSAWTVDLGDASDEEQKDAGKPSPAAKQSSSSTSASGSTSTGKKPKDKRRNSDTPSVASTTAPSIRPDDGSSDPRGWIFYNNNWHDGRRGIDGWGRYTRRRRWMRDAELMEVTPSTEITPVGSPRLKPAAAESVSDASTVASGGAEEKGAADGKDADTSTISSDHEGTSSALLDPSSAATDNGTSKSSRSKAQAKKLKEKTTQRKDSSDPSTSTSKKKSWFGKRRTVSTGTGETNNIHGASTSSLSLALSGSHPADSISDSASTTVVPEEDEEEEEEEEEQEGQTATPQEGGGGGGGEHGEKGTTPHPVPLAGPKHRRFNDSEDDGYIPLSYRGRQGTSALGGEWGVGDDAGMELG
ncbi:MAG: peroxisome- protein [Alyxoria varia]|nr:MAG: peroxisome- protein [Alyxoria varia]